MLWKALKDWGLKWSAANACVFLKKDLIVLVYVNDCILISKKIVSPASICQSLNNGPENFIFTDKGKLDKYLGVEIKKPDDAEGFAFMQPFLIQHILEAAKINTWMTNSRPTPVVGPLLSRDTDGPPFKHTWKYHTLTGMIGYLQQTSIWWLLINAQDSITTPNYAMNVPLNAFVKPFWRTDIKIRYITGIGMLRWCGLCCRMGYWPPDKPRICLIANRICHYVCRMSDLLEEQAPNQDSIKHNGWQIRPSVPLHAWSTAIPQPIEGNSWCLPSQESKPECYCRVWEENCICIKVAESPKFTHRTKHISLKYHHFWQFVSNGTIEINPINTREQLANIFTKPLDKKQFVYLRKKLCGW